jgi:hypothetical protein
MACAQMTRVSLSPLARAVRTYGSRNTSRSAARVCRIKIAARPVPRTNVGISICWSHSSGVVKRLALKPPYGSQPSHTANTTMSIMPSQKCGMATPEMAKVVTAISSRELRRIADTVPRGIPSNRPNSHAFRPNCTVKRSRATIWGNTSMPLRYDFPQSPRKMSASQTPYCTSTGRSSPKSFLILAYSAGSMAPLSSIPANKRAGSLGSQRTSAKTPRLTRSRVGIMFSSRRTRYFCTLCLLNSYLRQKSPGLINPSPRIGLVSQPPVVGM